MNRKGELEWPVRILIMLLTVLIISLIYLGFFVPIVGAAEDATGCEGAMRAIASAISSTTGEQIC